MGINTTKFIRKPLYVDAVRINAGNFDDVVAWCQGEVEIDETSKKKYIKVRVHNPKNPRQTKAFVGDWLLYTERGYKVYTNKAFHASFDKAKVATREELEKAFGTKEKAQARQEVGEVETNGAAVTQVQVEPAIQTETPQVIEQATVHHVSVHEKADPGNGVHPITEVVPSLEPVGDDGLTDSERALKEQEEAEDREIVVHGPPDASGATPPPTPQTVEDVPEQEHIVPAAAEGKRVLSIEEQRAMSPEELKELIMAGEVVLAQDLATPQG